MTQFFRTWDSANFVCWSLGLCKVELIPLQLVVDFPTTLNVGSRHPEMFVKTTAIQSPTKAPSQADRVCTNTWQICLRHLVALGSAYPHQKSQLLKLNVKIPGHFVGTFDIRIRYNRFVGMNPSLDLYVLCIICGLFLMIRICPWIRPATVWCMPGCSTGIAQPQGSTFIAWRKWYFRHDSVLRPFSGPFNAFKMFPN